MLPILAGLALSAHIYVHELPVSNIRQTIQTIHARTPSTLFTAELPKKVDLSNAVISNISVNAGDSAVTQDTLNAVKNLINRTSLPILKHYINNVPSKTVTVVLFSSADSYGSALLSAGVPKSSISDYTEKTGGITVDSDIWIPLYNVDDLSELANVLTHELTHVTFNQMGLGDKLPTWINEGAAWRDGLLAKQKYSSIETMNEMISQQMDVLQAAGSGQMLPLTATEQDILDANYNVEYEDFMAVETLVKEFGAGKFKTFLAEAQQKDLNQAFQSTYNMSIEDYQDTFIQSF